VTDKDLSSSQKFQALLEAEAVTIETKTGKRGPAPCFARTDDFMQALAKSEIPRIQQLAEGEEPDHCNPGPTAERGSRPWSAARLFALLRRRTD
jgi:hypothetical protein